jgi:tetratricopeptide (TPR) repeat protein
LLTHRSSLNQLDSQTVSYPYDLGRYSRKVTTTSAEAQKWFDRGLLWSYAFNHEEAARCFAWAVKYDPRCAMAYWGTAYAIGPNYNKTWSFYDPKDLAISAQKGRDALAHARQLVDVATPIEQALVWALAARFPAGDTAYKGSATLDRSYADAMREVYNNFASDADVSALYSEALMCIRPRQLWNLNTGMPTTKETLEARAVIEAGFALPGGDTHAALNHLYVHLMEMSSEPHLALPAADRLRGLIPDGSHLQHMATHIDAAVGDYRHSIESNQKAISSDEAYFARNTASVEYQGYRAHNLSALVYAAMMAGRSADAIGAARHLRTVLTPELVAVTSPPMVDIVEFHGGTLVHTLIRFGRWKEILELEAPEDKRIWSITTAITHYGKALALGVLGQRDKARAERDLFEAARAVVPKDRQWGLFSKAHVVLDVASLMCEGEIVYREGDYDTAFQLLRKAIELEDKLPYSDPPLWMQPVRHALGALLLEQGHTQEAETVYRQDLGLSKVLPRRKAHLGNVWGLHGLHECLVRNGKEEEAWVLSLQKDIVVASADISVAASCFCRVSTVGNETNGICCT